MKRKLYRAWQMRLFLGGLLGVVALFAAAAYFSGPMVWASNEHVHLATDWSHRHMVFSAPKTWWQSFNLSRNPRYMQQWVRRNAEKKNIKHRPPHHEAVLKGDWSNYIGGNNVTNATAGAGMISFGLRRATNVHRQSVSIDKAARLRRNGHKAAVLWFTGLSGSGKSTIANLVEKELYARGAHTYLLDGDNVRHGLNRDLGFTDADRVENIRRVGETARLFVDAGIIVLCSFISPFRAERRMVRELVADGEFIEVFVDTPIVECMRRDPKGLYARAQAGKIKNFTGIDSPYEIPENPEIVVATLGSADEAAQQVIEELEGRLIVA